MFGILFVGRDKASAVPGEHECAGNASLIPAYRLVAELKEVAAGFSLRDKETSA
jgi:hypothetical protein